MSDDTSLGDLEKRSITDAASSARSASSANSASSSSDPAATETAPSDAYGSGMQLLVDDEELRTLLRNGLFGLHADDIERDLHRNKVILYSPSHDMEYITASAKEYLISKAQSIKKEPHILEDPANFYSYIEKYVAQKTIHQTLKDFCKNYYTQHGFGNILQNSFELQLMTKPLENNLGPWLSGREDKRPGIHEFFPIENGLSLVETIWPKPIYTTPPDIVTLEYLDPNNPPIKFKLSSEITVDPGSQQPQVHIKSLTIEVDEEQLDYVVKLFSYANLENYLQYVNPPNCRELLRTRITKEKTTLITELQEVIAAQMPQVQSSRTRQQTPPSGPQEIYRSNDELLFESGLYEKLIPKLHSFVKERHYSCEEFPISFTEIKRESVNLTGGKYLYNIFYSNPESKQKGIPTAAGTIEVLTPHSTPNWVAEKAGITDHKPLVIITCSTEQIPPSNPTNLQICQSIINTLQQEIAIQEQKKHQHSSHKSKDDLSAGSIISSSSLSSLSSTGSSSAEEDRSSTPTESLSTSSTDPKSSSSTLSLVTPPSSSPILSLEDVPDIEERPISTTPLKKEKNKVGSESTSPPPQLDEEELDSALRETREEKALRLQQVALKRQQEHERRGRSCMYTLLWPFHKEPAIPVPITYTEPSEQQPLGALHIEGDKRVIYTLLNSLFPIHEQELNGSLRIHAKMFDVPSSDPITQLANDWQRATVFLTPEQQLPKDTEALSPEQIQQRLQKFLGMKEGKDMLPEQQQLLNFLSHYMNQNNIYLVIEQLQASKLSNSGQTPPWVTTLDQQAHRNDWIDTLVYRYNNETQQVELEVSTTIPNSQGTPIISYKQLFVITPNLSKPLPDCTLQSIDIIPHDASCRKIIPPECATYLQPLCKKRKAKEKSKHLNPVYPPTCTLQPKTFAEIRQPPSPHLLSSSTLSLSSSPSHSFPSSSSSSSSSTLSQSYLDMTTAQPVALEPLKVFIDEELHTHLSLTGAHEQVCDRVEEIFTAKHPSIVTQQPKIPMDSLCKSKWGAKSTAEKMRQLEAYAFKIVDKIDGSITIEEGKILCCQTDQTLHYKFQLPESNGEIVNGSITLPKELTTTNSPGELTAALQANKQLIIQHIIEDYHKNLTKILLADIHRAQVEFQILNQEEKIRIMPTLDSLQKGLDFLTGSLSPEEKALIENMLIPNMHQGAVPYALSGYIESNFYSPIEYTVYSPDIPPDSPPDPSLKALADYKQACIVESLDKPERLPHYTYTLCPDHSILITSEFSLFSPDADDGKLIYTAQQRCRIQPPQPPNEVEPSIQIESIEFVVHDMEKFQKLFPAKVLDHFTLSAEMDVSKKTTLFDSISRIGVGQTKELSHPLCPSFTVSGLSNAQSGFSDTDALYKLETANGAQVILHLFAPYGGGELYNRAAKTLTSGPRSWLRIFKAPSDKTGFTLTFLMPTNYPAQEDMLYLIDSLSNTLGTPQRPSMLTSSSSLTLPPDISTSPTTSTSSQTSPTASTPTTQRLATPSSSPLLFSSAAHTATTTQQHPPLPSSSTDDGPSQQP